MKNLIKLTKNLISIPSYVDGNVDESQIGNYLYSYLTDNIYWLDIYKQPIENGRFNIVMTDKVDPEIVLISHMDTVKPAGNRKKMLNPLQKGNFLYGLGSADMKSGLAASLQALIDVGKTNGVAMILDCDEEYYFKGIEKIMEKFKFSPKLVICPEPTNLNIVNGCRGVIELEFRVIGKTAHAGTPQKGINAIEKTIVLVNELRNELKINDAKNLGSTTVNLSKINGGIAQNGDIGVQANAVADTADVLIDIRPADPDLNAREVFKRIKSIAADNDIKIRNRKINLDNKGYLTDRNMLYKFEDAVRKSGLNIDYEENLGNSGFFESAFAANNWNCPAINFGPTGKGHIPDEKVEISSVIKTYEVFKNLISKYKV